MKKFPRTWCLLTLAALISSSFLQTTSAQNERLVLNASIVYNGKQPLPTLEAGDFAVSIDNAPQKIVSFNHGNVPASVGILVDSSASTSRQSAKLLQYLAAGIDRLIQVGNPQNDYFVSTFNSRPGMVHGWTGDPQAIRSKLLQLQFKGNSALYDGLFSSIEYARTGRHLKQVLIVVSDGLDNNSQKTFKEVREFLKQSDVMLYGVVVTKDAGSAIAEEGAGAIAELCKVSGGPAVLMDKGINEKTITGAFELIGTDVRGQYELVIEPPQITTPPKWRKVKVTATYTDTGGKRKELKFRTREGFFR